MLQFLKKSSRSTICELHVSRIARELAGCCRSLDDLCCNFTMEVQNIPVVNHVPCAQWYKLVRVSPTLAQVWHRNSQGDLDRLVLEITDDGNPTPDPFNF